MTPPCSALREATDVATSPEEPRPASPMALAAAPLTGPALLIGVGSRVTTVVRAPGDDPSGLRIIRHGPVALAASQAEAARASAGAVARVIRAAAQQVAERARLEVWRGLACPVLGTAGAARAVIRLGAAGRSRATLEQVRAATETLAETWVAAKKDGCPQAWVEPMMVGSAVLGAVLEELGATEIAIEGEAPREGTLEID